MQRFFADAILLGLILHQMVHWWQYSKGEERMIVKILVVSPDLF
jgi:hypothetical protein